MGSQPVIVVGDPRRVRGHACRLRTGSSQSADNTYDTARSQTTVVGNKIVDNLAERASGPVSAIFRLSSPTCKPVFVSCASAHSIEVMSIVRKR